MTQTTLSLENFLEEEKISASEFLATVEQDGHNKDKVLLTPWNNQQCNCSQSLSVSKESITSVEKTDKTHFCCGQNHAVVKVNFKAGASVNLEELWKQLSAKNTSSPFDDTPYKSPLISGNDFNNTFFDYSYCQPAEIERRYCPQSGRLQSAFEAWRFVQIYRDIRTGKKCGEVAGPCYNGYSGGGGIA